MKFTRTRKNLNPNNIRIKRKFVWWPRSIGSVINSVTQIETTQFGIMTQL